MHYGANISTYLAWFLNKFVYSNIPLFLAVVMSESRYQILFGFLAFNITLLVTTYTSPDRDFDFYGNWNFIGNIIVFYGLVLGCIYAAYPQFLKVRPLNSKMGKTWEEWVFSDSIYIKIYLALYLFLIVCCLLCDLPRLKESVQQKIVDSTQVRQKEISKDVNEWKEKL